MTDDQRKHLELIQTIIARLASGSFTIKGWSITLASALLALALKDSDKHLALLSLLPVSLFWLQDAYFLHRERLFRGLYEAVRRAAVDGRSDGPPTLSMDVNAHVTNAGSSVGALFSGSLLIFHGGLAILIILGVCIAGLRGTTPSAPGAPTSVASTPSQGKTP